MHVFKNGAHICGGLAALYILVSSFPIAAQNQGRVESELGTRLAQAPQVQSAPTQAQPFWGVNCAGTPSGLDCRALQGVPMTNSGQLNVAVRIPTDTKKPTMLVLVPAGIYLPAGVTLQFGQEEAKAVRLQSCDNSGCLAEYAITDAELAVMTKGQAVTVSIQDRNRQPISVQLPSTGFAAAYAKIK
jgi:invasion protein IalB